MKRILVGVIALMTLLAGCGGDSEESSNTTGTATTATTIDDSVGGDVGEDAAGGDDSEATGFGDTGPEVDACALLTLDEIENVLGFTPSDGVPEDAPAPFYSCRWETESFESLSLSVISWGSADDARASFDLFLGDVTEVDGIGDAALSNILTDLAFIVDGFEVTIDVLLDADDATQQAPAQALAPLVISRLP